MMQSIALVCKYWFNHIGIIEWGHGGNCCSVERRWVVGSYDLRRYNIHSDGGLSVRKEKGDTNIVYALTETN
jgi:hypothetical protein